MDRRATAEEKLIGEAIGEDEIFAATGCNLDASHVLPKILWLKNHTAILKNTYKLLVPASYILFFLTGKFGLDVLPQTELEFFLVYVSTISMWREHDKEEEFQSGTKSYHH